jgi:hypothetical protein
LLFLFAVEILKQAVEREGRHLAAMEKTHGPETFECKVARAEYKLALAKLEVAESKPGSDEHTMAMSARCAAFAEWEKLQGEQAPGGN